MGGRLVSAQPGEHRHAHHADYDPQTATDDAGWGKSHTAFGCEQGSCPTCIDGIRPCANSRPGPKSGVRFLVIPTLAIQQLQDSHSVKVPTLPAGVGGDQLLCLSAEISTVEARRDSGH